MAIRRIDEERGRAPEDDRPVSGLASDLTSEVSTLFRQEIALARAETQENIAHARSGAMMIGAGSIITAAGLFVLLMAAVYALAEVMSMGWAALIVGAVAAIIGGLVAKSGANNLKARDLMPERTARTLKEDAQMAQRRAQ